MHGQHQVGLLDHLRGVEPYVGLVKQQRVFGLLGEVPLAKRGEPVALLVHAEALVERDVRGVGGIAPGRDLLGRHVKVAGRLGMTVAGVRRDAQVVGGHQVGEDVVAHDGGVLVGTGHAVEVPGAVAIVVAEGQPQPRRLDQHLEAAVGLQRLISGDDAVALERRGDVGVHVPGGSARGPVRRALLPADGAPREARTGEVKLLGPLSGEVDGGGTPPQGVGGGVRLGIRQHGKHETLGVPERVAVVPGAGETLAGDGPTLGAGAGLEDVEQPEAHGLLGLGIPLDLDVGAVPEVIQVFTLSVEQALPSGVAGTVEGSCDLVGQGGPGAQARPSVGQVLDDAQLLAGAKSADDRGAG